MDTELHPRDWRFARPRWWVSLGFAVPWYLLAYGAAVLAGARVAFPGAATFVFWAPAFAGRWTATRFVGAQLAAGEPWPDVRVAPFGAAPWGASTALMAAAMFVGAAATAELASDENDQAGGLLLAFALSLAAAWALDLVVGRRDRAAAKAYDAAHPEQAA